MKGFILIVLGFCFMFTSIDTYAGKRSSKRSKSNIYISKKYTGHNCPKPRNIINAKYF